MISFIICSRNEALLQSVSLNIAATVGTAFEIIAISNGTEQKGICEVYNTGAGKAKYPILCFVHEDVIFHTAGWGKIAINYFELDSTLAMVGFAGSVYKCRGITGWSEAGHDWPEIRRMNMCHHVKPSSTVESLISNPFNEKISEVAIIDGVCMITRKTLWQQYNFDQNLLKGFHGYDLDFSMGIGQKGKLIVTHEIFIEHFSGGTRNWDWFESLVQVHKKWKSKLPVNIGKRVSIKNENSDLLKQLRKHLLVIAKLKPGVYKYFQFYFSAMSFINDKVSFKNKVSSAGKNFAIALRYYFKDVA